MTLLVIMTSYLCDACFFTNCPNKWEWGELPNKRSADKVEQQAEETEQSRLLKTILDKYFNKVSFYF